MDEYIFEVLERYYKALEYKGYVADNNLFKMLLLSFYRDVIYSNNKGFIDKDDYITIERALDCIYGSDCIIPYPDYIDYKMHAESYEESNAPSYMSTVDSTNEFKLYLGNFSELSQRIAQLEDTKVVKLTDGNNSDSDVEITFE